MPAAAEKVTALVPIRPGIKLPSGKWPEAYKREVAKYAEAHGDKAAAVKFKLRDNGQIWQWRRWAAGKPIKLTEEEKAARGPHPQGGARALSAAGKQLRSGRYYTEATKAAVIAHAREHGAKSASDRFGGVHVSTIWAWLRVADGLPLKAGKGPRRKFGSVKVDGDSFMATWFDADGIQRKKRGFVLRSDAGAFLDDLQNDTRGAQTSLAIATPNALVTKRQKPQQLDLIQMGEQRLMVDSLQEENEKLWELIAIIKRRRP